MTGLLPLWGAVGETTVESQFADFYRTRLARVPGARVRASDILEEHRHWAGRSGAATISFKELRRLMVRLGHRHFYSDGARYGDVAVLTDGDAIVLDAVRHRAGRAASAAIVERIDRAMHELSDLRRIVIEAAR